MIWVFSSFEKVQNWEFAFYEQENILKHIEYGVIDFSYSIWQIEHHMKCHPDSVKKIAFQFAGLQTHCVHANNHTAQ